MDAPTLTAALKQKAFLLGFDLAEPASVPFFKTDFSHLERWLDQGNSGEMRFFADRMEAYRDPNLVLEGVKSVLMLGLNCRSVEPVEPQAGQGRISSYAWGSDYHDVIHERLQQLVDFHRQLVSAGQARGVVGSAPLMEKSLAARAGLGWIGKNTLLINRKYGSWLRLAALLTTEELTLPIQTQGERPWVSAENQEGRNPCKNCHACLDACPTGALTAPYQLDARKCISYLTIEHRGEIPEEYKKAIGDRLFGCDACQEACPWNRRTPATAEKAFHPREGMNPVDLADLQNLDEATFRRLFRHTPLWRAKLEGILRNAAIVQENGKTI